MAYNLNFDPTRFKNLALGDSPEADSLPLTSDRFVTREELEEGRRERMPEGVEPDSFLVDADTLSVPGFEKNLRLAGINAWETSDNSQVDRQRERIARMTGKDPSEVTLSDVKKAGLMARGKAEELFADGAYITQIGTDPYGRPRVSAHTQDGKDISEALNNPFLNAAYGTKYNRASRVRKAFDEQRTEQWARRQGYKTSGYNPETGVPEIQQNPVTGEFHIGQDKYETLEMAEKFAPLIIADYESRQSWRGPGAQVAARGTAGAQQLWADVIERNILSAKHGSSVTFDERVKEYNSVQLYDDPRTGDTFVDKDAQITPAELSQYKNIKAKDPDTLNSVELDFLSSERGQTLANLDDRFVQKEAAYKAQEEKESDRAIKVDRFGDTARSMNFNVIAENEGIVPALLHAFHPENMVASTGQMVESLPFMALLASTPYVSVPGMAALYNSSLQKNKQEYAQLNGKAPEGDSLAALHAGTAFQILGEKIGADVLFKGIPGGKQVFDKFMASRLPGFAFKPLNTSRILGETVIGEGSSGAITTAGELFAQGRPQDPIAIAEGAAQEATGAIGMRGGIGAARTGLNVVRRQKIAFTDDQLKGAVNSAKHYKQQQDSGKLTEEQLPRNAEKFDDSVNRVYELWQRAIDKGDNKNAIKARDALLDVAPLKYLDQRQQTFDKTSDELNQQVKKYSELKEKKEAGEDVVKDQIDNGLEFIKSTETLVQLREDLKSAANKVAETDPEGAAVINQRADAVAGQVTQARQILNLIAADNTALQEAVVEAEGTKRLFSIDFESTKKSDIDVRDLPREDQSLYKAREDLRGERTALVKRASTQRNKSLQQVNQDIVGGDSGAYIGGDQYIAQAERGLLLTDPAKAAGFERFVKGIRDKAKAFRNAQQKFQKTGKPVYINKNTLNFEDKESADISSDTHWFVDKRSDKLVQAVQDNADYLNKTQKYINQVNARLKTQLPAMNLEAEDLAKAQQVAQGIQVLDAVEAVVNPKEEGSLEDIAKPAKPAKPAKTTESAEPAKPAETEVAEVAETASLLDRLKNRLLPLKSKYIKDRSEIFKSSSTKQGTLFPVLSQRLAEGKPLTEKKLTELITDTLKQQLGENASAAEQESVQKQAQLLSKTFASFKKLLKSNPEFISQAESQVATSNVSMLYVKDADGNVTLPDEYLMAASIALLSWIKSDGKKSLNLPESAISSMLFGKDYYKIPKQIQKQLKNFGVPANVAAQSIGADISAALGIRVEQVEGDPDRNNVINQEKFVSSLGLMALDLASHNSLPDGERLLVPRQAIEVKLDKNDFANQDIEDGDFNETFFGDTFIEHITTKIPFNPKPDPKGKVVPSSRLNNIIDTLRDKADLPNGKPFGLDQVFSELAGAQFTPSDYHTKPVQGTQETTRNSIYPVSPENKKAQEVAQSRPWRPIVEFMEAYGILTPEVKEALYGVKSTAELLTQQVAGVESANADKDNDIEILDNLKDDEIYFRYGVMNQERLYIKSSTLNPQSSKLHRFAISSAETEKIDTPEQRNGFKLAILQAFGEDIDKRSGATSLRKFDGILNDPLVQQALEAYRTKDAETFNTKVLDLNQKYEPDHGYHMVLGLVSLANYNETSPFDTNMVMEIDAVTSGYAISIFQFLGSDTEKTLEDLRRTGTFSETDDDSFDSYQDKGFPDTYQLIGKIVGEFFRGDFDLSEQGKKINSAVRDAISALQPSFFEADGSLAKFARKVAKSPFMIFNYAGGLKSISQAVAKERSESIIQDISSLQNKWKAEKDSAAKDQLETDLQNIENNLRRLGMTQGNLVGRLKDGTLDTFELSWKEEKQINRNIADVYYQAFELAMPTVLEGITERRDDLNAAVEAWYFAYQEKAESWLKENYPQAKEYHYTHWLEAQKALAKEGIHFAIDGVNAEGKMAGKISLFKQESDFDNKGKVENQHGKNSITTRVIRVDGKSAPVDSGSRKSTTSTTRPYRYKFAAPGVSGTVRGVQNIDSGQFSTGFLAVDGKMVPLYDAGISTPSVMGSAARSMSDRFLEAGFNHSIVDQVYQGLKNTLTSMTPEQVERAKARHLAEGRKTKDKKQPDIQDRYDAIRNLSTIMKTEREALQEALGTAKVDHYFMPSTETSEAPIQRPSVVKGMQGTIPPKNARESLIGWLDRILSDKPDDFVNGVSDKEWARANNTKSIDDVVQLEIDGLTNVSLLQAALIRQAMENVGNRNGRYIINQLVRDLGTIAETPALNTTATARALQSLVDQLAAKETGKKPDYQSINADVDVQMEHIFEHSDAAVVGERVFDKLVEKDLPNTDEKGREHFDHLRKINKSLILPAVNALSGVKVTINRILDKGQFSFGYANVTGKRSIVINQSDYTPRTYAEQTDAEIEVHEKVHIVTEAALSDPVYAAHVRKLRTAAKSQVTWRDFLARDAQGNVLVRNDIKEEIRHAKLMYNSVFGDTVAGNQGLAEFIAYGLTNRHLVGRLQQIKVPKEKFFAGETLFEKILNAFAKATSIFRSMAPKANSNENIYQALEKATIQIVQSNEAKKDAIRSTLLDRKTQEFRDNMNAKIIKMGTKIFKKIGDKLAKERDPNKPVNLRFRDPKNAFQAIMSAVGIGFTELPYIIQNEPRAMQALSRAADMTYRRNAFLNESVNMFKRLGKTIPTSFHRFADLRNKRIDVARKEMEELQIEELKGAFHNPELVENDEVKAALTRVFLRTDISTLLEDGGYNFENIRQLLFNDDYRKAEIRQRLRSNGIKQGTWLHMQVTQLAEKLVTGKARGHLIFQNAHAIAANIPAKEQRPGITDTPGFIRELDQVITLLAMDKTPVENRNMIQQVTDAEYASDSSTNGITYLIQTLRRTKLDALRDNFDDNPMHMKKGYKSSEIDPFTAVKVDSVAQHRQLKKEGYELVSRLPAIPGATTDQYGLYVNRNTPKTTREQGLLSATTVGHAGTSVRTMIARTVSAGTVGVEFQQLLKREMKQASSLKLEQFGTLEPIVNAKGEITDLVMSMSHQNRETHLKDDMDIFTNVGAIVRRTTDRRNTIQHNKEVVRELKKKADKEQPQREWSFINIFDEQYAEYFNSLHPESKREFRLLADTEGKGKNTKFTFYVERDWLPVIFSHDRYSIAGLVEKLPESGQKQLAGLKRRIAQGEKVMEDLSSYIKSVIALRLPTVLIANLISNANYSLFHGVPVSYLAERWHLILKEFNRVSKLSQELQRTQLKIETDKTAGVNPKLAARRDSLIQELDDSFIKQYMDRGFYSGITEDINTGRNTYRTRAFQTAGDKLQELVPLSGKARQTIHTGIKHLYLTEKSQFFKGAQHILRTSDFINKVMLHDFLTNYKGFSDDQAYGMVQRAFVNYNVALPRMLSYLESVGLLRFGKYWYGIQQANIEMAKTRPLEVGAFMLFKAMTGVSVPSIFDSSVFMGSTPQLFKMGSWPTYLLEPPALRLLDLDNWTP